MKFVEEGVNKGMTVSRLKPNPRQVHEIITRRKAGSSRLKIWLRVCAGALKKGCYFTWISFHGTSP